MHWPRFGRKSSVSGACGDEFGVAKRTARVQQYGG